MKIQIPKMPQWEQIGGDMSPGTYGATIARGDGSSIELLKIQPVREYVGDKEAADVGFPFWTREAYYDLDDLDPSHADVQSALDSIGMNMKTLEADFTPTQRAIVIAEALLDYGKADEGPHGWSDDILHEEVKWWGGKVAGPEYLEDEDRAFREEVLEEESFDPEDEDLHRQLLTAFEHEESPKAVSKRLIKLELDRRDEAKLLRYAKGWFEDFWGGTKMPWSQYESFIKAVVDSTRR